MGTPCDDDSLAGGGLLFRVGWVHTNAKRRYVPAFVRCADVDHAGVSREEGAQEAHPRGNDGKRLVVSEEDVSLVGRGSEVRGE